MKVHWILLFGVLGQQVIASEPITPVKVIVLFTSHGCSSCPPAEKLFHQLLDDDPAIVGLEYHVDYWNSLVHGSDGNFVDPYSKAEYSERQRAYNVADLQGRPGVYTPQAVINGSIAVVGSNRRHLHQALSRIQPSLLSIEFDGLNEDQTKLQVTLTPRASAAQTVQGFDINLVRFLDSATTKVTGGENRHRTLQNTNIVLDNQVIGRVSGSGSTQLEIEAAAPDQGCAIIVQTGSLTPVLAAALCP